MCLFSSVDTLILLSFDSVFFRKGIFSYLHDLFKFDTVSNTWEDITSLVSGSRLPGISSFNMISNSDGNIYLFGGTGGMLSCARVFDVVIRHQTRNVTMVLTYKCFWHIWPSLVHRIQYQFLSPGNLKVHCGGTDKLNARAWSNAAWTAVCWNDFVGRCNDIHLWGLETWLFAYC